MDEGGYSISSTRGGKSYRTVFTNNAPVASEVMLSAIADLTLKVLNDANWYWTSGTYGTRQALSGHLLTHT